MSQDFNPTPGSIQTVIFVAILLALFILVCTLFAPFMSVLLWAILLYILIAPLHQKFTAKMNFAKRRGAIVKSVIAAAFSLGTLFLILVPLFFVVSQLYAQIMELVYFVRDFIAGNPDIFNQIASRVSVFISEITSGLVVWTPDDMKHDLFQFLSSGTQSMFFAASSVVRNIGSFAINLVFMFFCLFFFFLDAPYLSALATHAIPIKPEHMATLVGKFKETTRNLFLGYIIVALVQGVVAYIIFSVFRIKGSLVLATLVLICSFIPMVGASLIWGPLGIVRILSGHILGGIVFLLVSGAGISLLDNFLRPFFLQDRIHLHPLVIFVSILGGISVYGFNGLVLGPMIVILFLTVLDMFLKEHNIPVNGIDR